MANNMEEPTEDVQDDSALILWFALLVAIYTAGLTWWWMRRQVMTKKYANKQELRMAAIRKQQQLLQQQAKAASKQARKNATQPTMPKQLPPPPPPPAVVVAPPAAKPWSHKQRIVILVCLWTLTAILITYASRVLRQAKFDPYVIMGVSQDASMSEIKKTYRKLSLDFHPDRWAKKSAVEQMEAKRIFQRIAKAYNTLVDPQAMDNWIKFGHPDGPRPFRWGDGVPSFVKNNSRLMAIFPVLMGLVAMWWLFSFLKRMGSDFATDEEDDGVQDDSDEYDED